MQTLQFVKTSPKLLKNIALKEVQRNQCVIGVKARPSPSLPASSVMQTLVEVLKTLNAAAVTDSLGQLCEAGMSQALHNQGLVKCESLSPFMDYSRLVICPRERQPFGSFSACPDAETH